MGLGAGPIRGWVKFGAASKAGFGGLAHAQTYGLKSYKGLRAQLTGTGLQAHHLLEKRFANVLGQKPGDMLSVAVSPAEHQIFTNAWRQAIPYGAGTANATRQQVMDAARVIYKDYPEILKSLGL